MNNYIYTYNYNTNNLWIKNINVNNYNQNLNPYLILKMIKDENKKNNNNKYFYLFNTDSIFIIHKLNNILLIKSFNINLNRKIEYSSFLIIYLLKYVTLVNKIDNKIVNKILLQIYNFLKTFELTTIHKKQSYNFCKYNYKCKTYYKNKKCNFDHYCYKKVCKDIQNLKNKINKIDDESLKKYIVTLHYVIEHIYNEFFMYRYIIET